MTITQTYVVRRIAPEDIRPGTYIAILDQVEMPCFCAPDDAKPRWEPSDAPYPRRVVAVCLPFVFAADPWGEFATLDIRRVRLAGLPGDYGQIAFGSLRRAGANRKGDDRDDA